MRKFFCGECSYVYNPLFGEEEYDIAPGTEFESIETFSCPNCGASKDDFIAPKEEIRTVLDKKDLLELEEMHVPRYFFQDDALIVQVGSDDIPHPDEEDHKIEWIGVFDLDGEMIEYSAFPPENTAKFE